MGAASRRETRHVLLQAAGKLFADRGYSATTVAAIAREAGASVQTLYLAWGSKRALLHAFLETALSGSDDGIDDATWAATIAQRAQHVRRHGPSTPSPEEHLRGIANQIRVMAEGGPDRPPAGLAWRLYRDAAATDAEIAADWTTLQRLRRDTCGKLIDLLGPDALRSDLTPDQAADILWNITSPETHELFTRHADFNFDEYERWMAATLVTALLPPT